ncbi:amino acid permease [Hortaea werneckii]|nr:amino acid permease [Hortaea werneckii]KAI7005103.1 amino acid permease [Hortaea werneckii]KAI7661743.1 amino acid permease [Hortaea werneckii]
MQAPEKNFIVSQAPTQDGHVSTQSPKTGNLADQKGMERMNKTQETRRDFKNVTMLAFSMILMCSWEGVLSTSAIAFGNGGRAGALYTNLAVWLGFIAVYASLGELGTSLLRGLEADQAIRQYHWVSELAPKRWQKLLNYIVGWLGVLGWQTGIAFSGYLTGTQIQGLLVLNYPGYVFERWHGTLLIIAMLLFAVFFNTVLAHRLPLVEGLILIIHVFGFIGIFATLLALSPKASQEAVWNTFYDPGWNNTGLSTLIGGLVAAIAPLLGADAAGKSTHKLQDAAYTLPRVMTLATFANGLMAFVMLIAICYCIGDIDAVLGTPTGYPFIQIFYNTTGSLAATNAMTAFIIILSASSCITIMAGSSRQLFAFARGDGLPFSKWVAHVRPGLDVPVNAILVSFTFAACISLVNIGSTAAFNSITSLGTGTLTISYIICLSCMIWLRINGKPLLPSRFDLGRSFGLALNVTAVGFLVLVFVIAFFPPVPEPLLAVVSMNWSILIFGVVVLFSMLYYFLWGRKVYVGPVEYVRVLG